MINTSREYEFMFYTFKLLRSHTEKYYDGSRKGVLVAIWPKKGVLSGEMFIQYV